MEEESVKEIDPQNTNEEISKKEEEVMNAPEKDQSVELMAASAEQTEKDGATESSSKDDKDGNHLCIDSEHQEVLKSGTVLYQGADRTLTITAKHLRIESASDQEPRKKKTKHSEAFETAWQHVICAKIDAKVSEELQKTSFVVHYMRLNKKKLQMQTLNFAISEGTSDSWIEIINEYCGKVEGRPKKAFVLINPIGGAGNSRRLFDKKVAPILKLAQIQAEVVYTERSKHAIEICETTDFSPYDCVLSVGGDGLYQEVLQGMTVRCQKQAGVNYNDVNTKFASLNTPIAIIPAGTGNGISAMINQGVKDIETATLRILTGEIHKAQVFTVHSNGKFFCLCGLLFGYGFFSDLIKRTEELRWMKRARYPYCLLATLVKKKRRTAYTFEYCLSPHSSQSSDSGNDKLSESAKNADTQADAHWIKHPHSGNEYAGISSFTANPESKEDRTFINLFSDGCQVFVDTGCGNIAMAKQMMNFMSGKKAENTTPNLEIIYSVKGLKIKVAREEGSKDEELTGARARTQSLDLNIDVDGECLVLDVPEFELWTVPSFAPLYGCYME